MSVHQVSQKVAAPYFIIFLWSPVNTVIYSPIFDVEYVLFWAFLTATAFFQSTQKAGYFPARQHHLCEENFQQHKW